MSVELDSEGAISIIKRVFGDKIRDLDLKMLEQLKLFRNSDALIYCDDCKMIFYSGKARVVAEEKRFVDWKMLSFRHVWDTKHKVKVFLPYFGLSTFSLSQYMPYFDPPDNRTVNYYETVEEKRYAMIECGDQRALKSFDENWVTPKPISRLKKFFAKIRQILRMEKDLSQAEKTPQDQCVCSTCDKNYYDPKDACYCCYGTKPWLPYKEADTIMVKP